MRTALISLKIWFTGGSLLNTVLILRVPNRQEIGRTATFSRALLSGFKCPMVNYQH
jgi:hypothetical protein